MDAEAKAKWVAALRSGDYQQGKSYLNSEGKFCCLGVLCEVMGLSKKIDVLGSIGYCFQTGISNSKCLPTEFSKVMGISQSREYSLAYMNDREDKSFLEIADYIEKEL